jgi:hypothetical protein
MVLGLFKSAALVAGLLLASVAMADDTASKATLGKTSYEVLTVPGREALTEWERIRDEGEFTPIILGGADDLERVASAVDPERTIGLQYVALQYGWGLKHPDGLAAMRDAEWEAFLQRYRERREDDIVASLEDEDEEPLGEWPDSADKNVGLLALFDWQTGDVHDEVHIVLLPGTDATRAPALLNFGGWNANPPPGFHVAALMSWQERYGAVPVLISGDVIELRVTRRPETREEALELAREQFLYSDDIVYQGVGSISNLAASLMVSDWWYFWWD